MEISAESYSEMVRSLSESGSAEFISTDVENDRTAILRELVRSARSSLLIAVKSLDQPAYKNKAVIAEFRTFLETRKGKGKIKVLVKSNDAGAESFKERIGLDGGESELMFEFYVANDDFELPVSFVCVDRKAFLVQSSKSDRTFASFNQPEQATQIEDVFENFRKKAGICEPA